MRMPLVLVVVAASTVMAVASPAYAGGNLLRVDAGSRTITFSSSLADNDYLSVYMGGKDYVFDDSVDVQVGSGCWHPSTSDLTLARCHLGDVAIVLIESGPGDDYLDYLGESNSQLIAGDGDDVVLGGRGEDLIRGGDGNDYLNGYGGDDTFDGGPGADRIDGGAGGEDKVTYEYHPGPVYVDLDVVAADDGMSGEGDMLGRDVEHVVGSAFDDVIYGSGESNVLWGCGGNDFLYGQGGADWLIGDCENPAHTAGSDSLNGGDGEDWVSYYEHTTAVNVDNDGESYDDGSVGERDTVWSNVENISGGTGDDVIVGNSGRNRLDGYLGNDRIFGLGGDDALIGFWAWRGPLSGPDDDWLYGGTGADTLDGSGGFDHCYVESGGLSTTNCESP
jgi:Ca2+-binding RTX toxin-like protein